MKIYFDHAATTPIDPEVKRAMLPYLDKKFGNPSSIFHYAGQEAYKAIESSRNKIAQFLNCQPEEIIFTSGGTESDNLALKGIFEALKNKGNHIITSSIEHHAVLSTCEYLEKYHQAKITYLPVNRYGLVNLIDLEKAINSKTILISIMYANNEVGTIEPIAEIGRLLKDINLKRKNKIFFHTDAVQAIGMLDCDVSKLGVDALSFSGHKIYGPKGIGALYLKKGTPLIPQLQGGGQEKGRRAGTENVAGIVGLGKAIEIIRKKKNSLNKIQKLRDCLIKGILTKIPGIILTGHPQKRLPNNASFCIKNVEGEALLISLNESGIAASSGSACTSGSLEPSHVLLAMGIKPEIAHGSLRLTLGQDNTKDDINYLLEVLPKIVKRLRKISPFNKY